MTTTPPKQQHLNHASIVTPNLTPVRFLDSPKAASSDSNVAATRARLEIILKALQDNYAKWQLAHKRGLALCTAIEAIKTRALEANSGSSNVDTLYPPELKAYCDKLSIIATIFSDITSNAQQSLRQLRSLSKLPGCSNETFYRSWQMPQFLEFVERLAQLYANECVIKQSVMQQLPHCINRAQLIRSSAAWEYAQHADDSVTLMFSYLTEEMKTNKK